MSFKIAYASLLVAIPASFCLTGFAESPTPKDAPPIVSDAKKSVMSAYQCPEWFQDAKFGIWSHWGPDSVPGLFNNYAHDLWSQDSVEYKWHVEHYGHPSKAGYVEVIESWKAEKFDPDALVAKYKAAGAQYVVALATHHDNVDCFNSTYHEWNSVGGRHPTREGMAQPARGFF